MSRTPVRWLYDIVERVRGRPRIWRPFHDVFLERVIKIDAVQRERRLVTEPDDEVRDFFDYGRIPGDIGKYLWPLDGAPEPFPQGINIAATWDRANVHKAPMSPAMQRAWSAALAAKSKFVADLRDGDPPVTGTYSATGERRPIYPAEWHTGLWVDVCVDALGSRERGNKLIPLWTGIVLQGRAEPASTPSARSRERQPWEIEREMICAILERAFPGKGPNYVGLGMTRHLLPAVRDGWKAECVARKFEYLIANPPNREKVERAIGRRD
jgi:hypothetical protein